MAISKKNVNILNEETLGGKKKITSGNGGNATADTIKKNGLAAKANTMNVAFVDDKKVSPDVSANTVKPSANPTPAYVAAHQPTMAQQTAPLKGGENRKPVGYSPQNLVYPEYQSPVTGGNVMAAPAAPAAITLPTYTAQGYVAPATQAGDRPTWNYDVAQPGAFSFNAEAPGAFNYNAAAPTFNYAAPAPGPFTYDASKPADFQYQKFQDDAQKPADFQYQGFSYNEARPGDFQYRGFQYGAAKPADFQYNEEKPKEFTYDESGKPGEFSYDAARPEYTNAYQDRINAQADSILNRPAFAYDYNADPLYQQYAEAYTRNGAAAMQDTLAQMAARTGGLASSYAGTAAQGTYNQYMQALDDKIPELYQLAYSMYKDDDATMRNNLSMLQGLENTDYSRYMDQLGQYNTDRSLAYDQYLNGLNQWNSDRSFAYNQFADQMNQWNADRAFSYGQYQDQINQWNADRDFAYNQYANDRNLDYNIWANQMNQWNADRDFAYNQYANDRNFAYNQYADQVNQYNADRAFAYDQYANDRNFAYNQYADQLNQYNADRNFAYNQYADDVNRYNADRTFAYGQYQDQLGQYNNDRNFAYNQYADEVNRYNADRNFAYNQYADELNQWNQNRNFDYGVYADQLNQWNTDRNFDYNAAQDALAQANWEQQFNYSAAQDALAQANWERQFNYNAQQDALDRATNEARYQYQVALDKYNAQNGKSASGSSSNATQSRSSAYSTLRNAGVKTYGGAYDALLMEGYPSTDADRLAKAYVEDLTNENRRTQVNAASVRDEADQYDYGVWKTGSGYEFMGKTYTDKNSMLNAVAKSNTSDDTFRNTLGTMLMNGIISEAEYNELKGSRKK